MCPARRNRQGLPFLRFLSLITSHQLFHYCLLHVQPVLRLVPDHRIRPFNDFFSYLLSPVGRETVEYDGIFLGYLHQFSVYLVSFKSNLPLFLLLFLAHGCPYVCIYHISVFCSFKGVRGKPYLSGRYLMGVGKNNRVRGVTLGAWKGQVKPELPSRLYP